MVIQRCGYGVIEAKTGQEAIDRATLDSPILIVLEFALPEINGHEVMAHLQRNAATENIPVLFQLPQGASEGIRWPDGVKEVLYKPFDLGDLPGILRKYLPQPPLAPMSKAERFGFIVK
jgi:CheY-like chemotaxis protein